ncbi:indoleamine 2,3-dioxygenase alpha type [Delitschia confertaspora ATCC 74209]|uniref:Indoleamine 2,3-dioxygenase n=1 Tax=Delitschia confertaspora ATCC 74209 TaxID=1513339 RepID=A0A9P4JN76_9PLEO|nr:indoleamine 2,3-dioxygenase alpha type [Delitschia confertaspora ATCC 74209]
MIPALPQLNDYDISPQYGFLPAELPLEILPDTYYAPWEAIIRNLQGLILSKRLRRVVDTLPVLSTDFLLTEAEWRRAYLILGFISHSYIWGGDTPEDAIPPPVSIPFRTVCEHLELPLVATYSGLTLWNWKPLFPGEPIDTLDNLATLSTFTGSLDESWFYLVSVAIEARAGPIIPMMIDAMAAARAHDSETVTACLQSFAERLDELGGLLNRMYESCDPHVFYHRIRPFLAGSKNMAEAGLPKGVVFDDGTGTQPYVQFSGGSNAQSSVIQFFDIVLGVEHRPTGQKHSSGSSSEGVVHAPSNNFIQDMRRYMPGPHRRFLEHVESVANLRDYVARHQSNRSLCIAFDACLAMLRAFRDKHIQMVSRYIIIKSRESRPHSRSLSPKQASTNKVNIALNLHRADSKGKDLRGTGGTALIPFLKQARDETGEPAINSWARRLLNNGPVEGVARLTKMSEHTDGAVAIVGLAGTWSVDDSEGGICHW